MEEKRARTQYFDGGVEGGLYIYARRPAPYLTRPFTTATNFVNSRLDQSSVQSQPRPTTMKYFTASLIDPAGYVLPHLSVTCTQTHALPGFSLTISITIYPGMGPSKLKLKVSIAVDCQRTYRGYCISPWESCPRD